MCGQKRLDLLQPHDHEGGGIGIGTHAVAGYDCGRENAVLHGVACLRVDGVCVFLSAFIIEVAVVAGSRYACIGDVQDCLQILIEG